MASSFFALFDDIATLLDDVAAMSKLATKKTAGVLGDDLALNAQQVTGIRAARELPVVWAVAKGSLLNKLVLVPAALLISALLPALILPLLMLGGAYLCYEGAEKVLHLFFHRGHAEKSPVERLQAAPDENQLVAMEKQKIRGAIRTDFILSAEIVVIALGVVAERELVMQALVLSLVAVLITVGVYGSVALIVKLDDIGLYLNRKSSALSQFFGRLLLALAPKLMKLLSVLGTVAMFMVGGGILVHGVPVLAHWLHQLEMTALDGIAATLFQVLVPNLFNLFVGFALGAVLVGVVSVLPSRR